MYRDIFVRRFLFSDNSLAAASKIGIECDFLLFVNANNAIRYCERNYGFEIQLRAHAYTEINSLAVTMADRFYRECFSFPSFGHENDVS